MTTQAIAGLNLEVDAEGFLTNPNDWNREIAEAMAAELGIELTPRHWEVIEFCRKDFQETGTVPTLRRITKVGGVPTKEIYKLFPKGPAKKVAKIAGLSKPTGCI